MPLPTRTPKDRFPYDKDPQSTHCTIMLLPGEYVYVQDADGVVWVAPNGPHRHPRVLGGALPAAAAGEIILGNDGIVTEPNNLSGAFQLGPETLDPVAEALRGMGFTLAEAAIKRFPRDFFA